MLTAPFTFMITLPLFYTSVLYSAFEFSIFHFILLKYFISPNPFSIFYQSITFNATLLTVFCFEDSLFQS